eukprot:7134984-Alexandrium_andersonii.AAC.1
MAGPGMVGGRRASRIWLRRVATAPNASPSSLRSSSERKRALRQRTAPTAAAHASQRLPGLL